MKETLQETEKLSKRIANMKQRQDFLSPAPKTQTRLLVDNIFRLTTEFVSPILIALGLGYLADRYFDTKPIIMLVAALFGGAAGCLNLYRAAQKMEEDINKE